MKSISRFSFLVLFIFSHHLPAEDEKRWRYLDNGILRIGIDAERGACIGFLSESSTKRNLLNHFDEGRFIQQSYYGAKDGSNWNGKPWRYNPIQGGSWKRQPSTVLDLKISPEKIESKVEPRHWTSGESCSDMVMEQTIVLEGPVAKVNCSATYTGPDQGEERHQEMPAVFVDAALKTLAYPLNGEIQIEAPRILAENQKKGKQGFAFGESSENWVAYLDDKRWGIGIYAPGTSRFTVYRALGDGTAGPTGSATSYVAFIRQFELTEKLVIEYEFYLTIGSLREIQERFRSLRRNEGSE